MAHFSFAQQREFVTFCGLSRRTIEMTSRPPIKLADGVAEGPPPPSLPQAVRTLLASILTLPIPIIDLLWEELKDEVWKTAPDETKATENEITRFSQHGLPLSIGYKHLYPPVNQCVTEGCPGGRITDSQQITTSAELFTLREGVVSTFRTKFHCLKCDTTYLPNYYISKGHLSDGQNESTVSLRQYYPGVPRYIEAGTHVYLDTPLLEFFATCKTFAWTSATNCSRIYNLSMSSMRSHIFAQQLAYMCGDSVPDTPKLQPSSVLDGFFLYSLLLDMAEHGRSLVLLNDSDSRTRLKSALYTRNKEMEGTGQEAYAHECDKCCYTYEKDGKMYKVVAAVSDGVTIGHPCCAVADCKNPLENHAKRFCIEHKSLDSKCAVVQCTALASPGHRTCNNSEHRSLEIVRAETSTAMFQLKNRLARSRATVLSEAPDTRETDNPYINDDVIIEVDEEAECATKPGTGNRKLRAIFGRRRTHNEQFMMRPCGVIISRCTFFGSEAISGVYQFFKGTFPTAKSTPSFLLYDNNCHIHKHIEATGCKHFENTAFPVDVFHFKSKHTEKDLTCELHCNPVAFAELHDAEDNWRFNSSICEQTNVWINGFQSILSDMEVTRFNFYLDEMVKRHNRFIISELSTKGTNPRWVPLEDLGM